AEMTAFSWSRALLRTATRIAMAQASSMSDPSNPTPTSKLQSLLTCEVTKAFDPRTIFWFIVSLIFAAVFAERALAQAFSSPYVLQDHLRHHVFLMARV